MKIEYITKELIPKRLVYERKMPLTSFVLGFLFVTVYLTIGKWKYSTVLINI